MLSLALLASLPFPSAGAGERVRAKGDRPDRAARGFVAAERFAGFQREDVQSSIR
jgi:hypothetical protein